MSGVNVHIDTSNPRDSIYGASVDFTLNTCGWYIFFRFNFSDGSCGLPFYDIQSPPF
ncbi:hypothetical protein HanPSC8_Chr14g0597021 [Helianthus annuus]|nr:hypothetical protein HanPSC8_Chr14g0597021 [Helianthus annuus]